MFMTKQNLTLLLSAVAVAESTLQLLIAVMGILAALITVTFVIGALSGAFITYYMLAREDS
jgi:hypothetical protein